MTTAWAITAGAERVALDPAGQAQVSFTVTNTGAVDDRAVVGVVAGENTDRGWFAVADHQRPVPHGGSALFLVTVTVPAGTAPGNHWLACRVRSADAAHEENSALSNRVVFAVAATAAPPPRRSRWPWLAAAALVLVVAGVVAFLLLHGNAAPSR